MHRFGLRRCAIVVLAFSLAGCAGLDVRDGEKGPGVQAGAPSTLQLLDMAAAAQREGRLHAALDHYRQVLGQEPDNERANVGAGQVLLAQHRPAQALARFEHILALSPELVVALEGKGYALIGMRRFRSAETALKKAVGLNPARWRSWSGLGVIADLRGDGKQAQSYYENALLVLPGQPQLLNNRAFSLMLTGGYQQAEALLRTALASQPGDVRIRNNLAWCLSWQKRYEEAMEVLAPAFSPAQMRNNVGYIAMQQGDLSTAAALFKKAMTLSPVYYERAANNLAEVERRLQAGAGR